MCFTGLGGHSRVFFLSFHGVLRGLGKFQSCSRDISDNCTKFKITGVFQWLSGCFRKVVEVFWHVSESFKVVSLSLRNFQDEGISWDVQGNLGGTREFEGVSKGVAMGFK